MEKNWELLYLGMHPNKTTTYRLLNDIALMDEESSVWEKMKAEFVIEYIRAALGGNKGIHKLGDYAQ